MSNKFMNGPLEHERQTRDALDSDSSKLDDVVTTSKAVSWPKVRNLILDHMLKSRWFTRFFPILLETTYYLLTLEASILKICSVST